ncbi:MAG: hypothetical protein ACMXYB_01075 [Candidatus Woesearchaeota archaeon]
MDEKQLFVKRFEEKLAQNLDMKTIQNLKNGDFEFKRELTQDYETFRLENLPSSFSIYEKICNISQKLLPIEPDKKSKEEIEGHIENSHLHITPMGVMSFTILGSLLLLLIGLGLFILGRSALAFGFIILSVAGYFILQKIPELFAINFKNKSNDQIITGIFYIVAYMRFNSNFELATEFAANYLQPPLSLDFKKVLWQLETSQFPSLKVAFDEYLKKWRDDNLEFLESIYLIESSLYESDESRRLTLLDKSLDIILQGNYEKMLHFAQELKEKISSFNMLGIVLPILGLIILPLAASFSNPQSVFEVMIIMYNILIPVFVGYSGFSLMKDRPGGNTTLSRNSIKTANLWQWYYKIGDKKRFQFPPIFTALFLGTILFILGIFPLLAHIGYDDSTCLSDLEINLNDRFRLIFDPRDTGNVFGTFQNYANLVQEDLFCYGPYGIFPGLLSILIPISLAYMLGTYFKLKTQPFMHLHDTTRLLERQFSTATFQLGNRLNEGISAELAFGAVADTMKGTPTGDFFSIIDKNIKFNGMSIEKAIFDGKKGAILDYPSELVISSMKIFIRAVEKGPEIAAKTLIDLSRYLSEMHMANERMKDLLAESVSSMKGQAKFLAPLISAVVVAIVSLVSLIMGQLSTSIDDLASQADGAALGSFSIGNGVPTFLFQTSVGLYLLSLIIILILIISQLDSNADPIHVQNELGTTMISSITKYAAVVGIGIVLFSFVGGSVLASL